MPQKLPEMERRRRAVEETRAKFGGKPFAWGKVDCVKVAAFLMRKMGHKPSFAKAGAWTTPLGARRALKRSGHARVADWVQASGPTEIAPALARLGDLLIHAEQGDGFEAIGIMLGNNAVLGFHDDDLAGGLAVLRVVAQGRVFRL